jgi:cytochrome c-type biogenesis protein CcmH
MKQDIPALRLQLQQLQAQHVAGTLDDAAYAQAKAPLEQLLLSCVLADDGQVRAEAAAAPRPGFKLLALLAVGVIGLAVAGYSYTGSPGATVLASSGDFAGTTGPDAERQQFVKAIEQLAQRLNSEPDNHEGWAMLARSYAALGEHAKAMSAFARTGPLLQTDAALAADYADAMGVLNNRSLQGEPSQWIERALKIDANHPKALALAGTAAMEREDFAGAARHWERLAALTPRGQAEGRRPARHGRGPRQRQAVGRSVGHPTRRARRRRCARQRPPVGRTGATGQSRRQRVRVHPRRRGPTHAAGHRAIPGERPATAVHAR